MREMLFFSFWMIEGGIPCQLVCTTPCTSAFVLHKALYNFFELNRLPYKSTSIGWVNETPATEHIGQWETAPDLCIALPHLEVVCGKNKTNRYILHCRRCHIENHSPHGCMIFEALFPKLFETPMFAHRGYPFTRYPHILCLFVELIQELLNLPQRIYLLLFAWAVAVAGHCKVPMEVLPATS
jgi:hypothetical protein